MVANEAREIIWGRSSLLANIAGPEIHIFLEITFDFSQNYLS